MSKARYVVLLEQTLKEICRVAHDALNSIDDGVWIVAQAKNGRLVTAELWFCEDSAMSRFTGLLKEEGPDGDTALFCVLTETPGEERRDEIEEHSERDKQWAELVERVRSKMKQKCLDVDSVDDFVVNSRGKLLLKLYENGDRSKALYEALEEFLR